MLALEQAHLQPLPAHPYDARDVLPRLVDDYQRVRLETNQYPVPAPVGDLVYVCADRKCVEIVDRYGRRLIEHERLPDGAGIKVAQLPGARRRGDRFDVDALIERLATWDELAAEYAQELRQARRSPGPELVRLVSLEIRWSRDDIVAAMQHAMNYRCFEVGKVERILELHHTPRRLSEQIGNASRRTIEQIKQQHPVPPRAPDAYQSLRDGDRLDADEEDDSDDDA